jgi:hypothetical protein
MGRQLDQPKPIDLDRLKKDAEWGRGKSKSAVRRRAERARGKLHTGRPGEVITMSGGREYTVAFDGSFRRQA